MSNSVQPISTTELTRLGSKQSTSVHLLFFDPGASDLEHRLQELRMVYPALTLGLHQLQPEDAVGQITRVLNRVEPGSVQQLWFVSGNEIESVPQPDAENNSRPASNTRRRSHLDKRISQWQPAFADDAVCYLLGDDLSELAFQIQELTQLAIRREIAPEPVKLLLDELIFVDQAALNCDQLVKDLLLKHDAEVVLLDSAVDGLEQIVDSLTGRTEIKAIHLICPGNDRALIIGQSVLNQNRFPRRQRETLRKIGAALARDAEIRIYNSQFNGGNQATETIRELSSATGAFVIVANSQSRHLAFDSDFVNRFSAPSSAPTETEEWNQLFSPAPNFDAGIRVLPQPDQDESLIWNQDHTELTIKTKFDQAQAMGWLCIGFTAGCAFPLLMFSLGFWGS